MHSRTSTFSHYSVIDKKIIEISHFGCTLLHTIELNWIESEVRYCHKDFISPFFLLHVIYHFHWLYRTALQLNTTQIFLLQHNSVGKVCEIDTVRKKLKFSCNLFFWHAFHSNVGKPSLSLQFKEKATAKRAREKSEKYFWSQF